MRKLLTLAVLSLFIVGCRPESDQDTVTEAAGTGRREANETTAMQQGTPDVTPGGGRTNYSGSPAQNQRPDQSE